MADLHDLHRVAFAAILDAPQFPVFGAANGVARAPKFRRDAGVKRVAQDAGALAVFYFHAISHENWKLSLRSSMLQLLSVAK